MPRAAILAFIALLRDPITGYDWDYERDVPNGNDAKERFENLGKRLLKEIATRLKLTDAKITWNPGGPAVSGDLYLEATGLYINFSQTALGFDWGFMYRYKDGGNRWMKWDELRHLDRLTETFANRPK